MTPHLNASNLVSKKEPKYFLILSAFSAIIWIVICLSIVGIAYGLFFALFLWCANGLLVARIRSESVECSVEQFPSLYQSLLSVCEKLGITSPPRLYVLQSNGFFNAFATRHSGRDFVVIYSTLHEAFGSDSNEMKFLLGHELGHIHRRHILKFLFLIPASVLPLIPKAYRRAVETTCDRYGTFASGDIESSARAMLILAGGKTASVEANSALFAQQYGRERGVFVSWHELASFYPTTSQRTYQIHRLAHEAHPESAPRPQLAYLLASLFDQQTFTLLILALYVAIFAMAGGPKVSYSERHPSCSASEDANPTQE